MTHAPALSLLGALCALAFTSSPTHAQPTTGTVPSTVPSAAANPATTATSTFSSAAAPKPQLVVLITVDQLRPEYLDRWASQMTGGLKRLWTQGAAFPNAIHDHATTETAPGHATLGSGRFPRHHAIVRNELGVLDAQSPLVDGGRGTGASPYRFRGSSFFDWMRARDPLTRGLSVSRKDRGAILPLGRAKQSAFWYSTDGRFVTSRYYADTLPTWVKTFNARDAVAALDGATWSPLLPASSYAERDDVARENSGRDFTFPHALPTDRARRASQLAEYPVMDSLTVAFALAGIEAMELGGRTSTDFLAVSLSTTDAVGHRYGPDSRELHDQVLRVDRYLGQLIDSLYRLRDSSRILIALSSDHGVAPFPELYFAGNDSTRGRVDVRPVLDRARATLLAAGVEGDAIEQEAGIIVLDTARLRAHGVSVDSTVDALHDQLRAVRGVMRVDRVPELEARAAQGDVFAKRWRNAIPDDMDAVLTVTVAPYHYWITYTNAGHGMPHEYDMRVPITFYGPAFVAGRYERAARTVDLVPTLASVLGVPPVEPIDGRPLLEAIAGDQVRGAGPSGTPVNAATGPSTAPARAGRTAAAAASATGGAAAGAAAPTVSPAAEPSARPVLPGFAAAIAESYKKVEADAIRLPDASRADAHVKALTGEPHVAGTDAQARTRDYVINAMQRMGLRTEVNSYRVWLPHATSVRAWRMGADTTELTLSEPPIAENPASALPQYPFANGYSAAGTAEGEVVFVNFGLIEDYAVLDSLGVSVKGKIVLARYGRSFRGIKAREAEKRGALALMIYTDPLDDGFVQGEVYPAGPMRPNTGIQRGSVYNGQGDPTTPGYASTPDAPRVPLEQTSVPRIPVIPISAQHAESLLREVRGTDIPRGWQGGLPLRYYVGPGPVRAKVSVETDANTNGYKTIWNTLGVLQGTEFPDEYVYIGAHRDGWGAGAADNISGTVSVLEAAESLSALAKRGIRPKRSIVFATWDAEEWGLIGSSEYVEDDSLKLIRGGVAYLNQDGAAQGPSFGGGGSPSLRSTLRSVVQNVPDPSGRGSVYEVWRANTGTTQASAEPAMGDPGGGSDFAGFYNHLGIPHADWGFSGPAGTYHSSYDGYDWMKRFGDPTFAYHATAARIGAAMALRIANADIHPYDYVEFTQTMQRYVPLVTRGLARNGWDSTWVTPLAQSVTRMQTAAAQFAAARDARLAGATPPKAVRERTNAALRRVERALTRASGLDGRPWWRSLIYAADIDNGYATMSFPGVNEAVRVRDAARTQRELADLSAAFDRATEALREATAAIGAR